jgi:outer membrane lipoprotein SlyB
VGGIAGASIGYGLGNRWDRTPGVIIGGLVGALAGSAIERSGC